jgi:uncharacterized repeat protein (TIGR01451 family)
MGDGAGGRSTVLNGTGFTPNAAYSVYFGGLPTLPATVNADAAGNIAAVSVALPPLPSGFHDVFLASPAWSVTMTGAYRVTPNICVSPIVGDGRAGQTWQTNPLMQAGSWVGMVFTVEGSGFSAGATIPANSITVGGATTWHGSIPIPATGRLPSTTVMVATDLSTGVKNVVLDDGTVRTFTGAYSIGRSIGLNPSRASRKGGTQIRIEGWGFTDGALGQVRIGTMPATFTPPVNIVNGHFVVTVTLAGDVANGFNDVSITDAGATTTFPGSYTGAANRFMALSPVSSSGIPNQAYLVQGLGGAWTNGALQAMSLNAGNTVVSTVSFPPTTVAGGAFPAVWASADSPVPASADRFVVTDAGGVAKESGVDIERSICLCPVSGNGASGWTVSVTGFGFAAGTNLVQGTVQTVTIGGATTWHGPATITDGSFGPLALAISYPLPFGPQDVVATDSGFPPAYFRQSFRVSRSIGLTAICGKGVSGETTLISGTGLIAGAIYPVNSNIYVGGLAVNHTAASVDTLGRLAPLSLSLMAMDAGAKSVELASQEVFPQAYRVYNPVVSVSKYRNPPAGVHGTEVTWSFSFTNTGYAGGGSVNGLVLIDTLPAGLSYVAGSADMTLPATAAWYHSGCACWTSSDSPTTDVVSVRWTLADPLPTGASGYASFRATVP